MSDFESSWPNPCLTVNMHCTSLMNNSKSNKNSTAFTRTEVLVILAVLGMFALLTLPALANGRQKSKTLTCLSNLKQLSLAWVLFANDHNDTLSGNFHGGLAQNPSANDPRSPWAVGWLDWTTSQHNTNTIYLTDSRYSKLASYFEREKAVYKCPEDNYLSTTQRQWGWTGRVRSYACDLAVGPGNAPEGPFDSLYYDQVQKLSGFLKPGPRDSFVFIEEHPDSINDPGLFPPHPAAWVDLPASFHGGACNLTFADGHVEMRQWQSTNTVVPVRVSTFSTIAVPSTDPDIVWFRAHTPRR